MAKALASFITFLSLLGSLFGQVSEAKIVSTDLDNYWLAYDKIIQASDSLERIEIINDLYINPGTEGLNGLISVRNYSDFEFVNNMLNYPQFWNSIRANQGDLWKDEAQVRLYLAKLKELYPELKPANIYMAVGAFRTGGTYEGNKVLLGAEYMLAHENSTLEELPERVQNAIKENAPYNIALTAVHEYIHTQQKSWENQSIIHLCVAEGVAEFISTLVTEQALSPPVKFGKENEERVLQSYMVEIFRDDDVWNWLWSQNQNELKVNDLGYYVGYEICERHYSNAKDKQQAMKDLMELDYSDDEAFAKLVDGTHFLPMTLEEIGIKYESMRPGVTRLVEFENGSMKVPSATKVITVEFSEPMSACCRSFDHDTSTAGELLKVVGAIGWSDDQRQFSFEVEELKANTAYHLIISNFAKEDGGNRLAPYTIAFKTAK